MSFQLITCTCCGAELTKPQFYNGKPYGYTCITKVNPLQVKTKATCILAKVIKDLTPSEDGLTTSRLLQFSIENKTVNIRMLLSAEQVSDTIVGSNMYLTLSDSKGNLTRIGETLKAYGVDVKTILKTRK